MPKSDKLYLSQKEWKGIGGKKNAEATDYRRLPFDHCALTLLPFTTPVCDQHGNVFELMSVAQHSTAQHSTALRVAHCPSAPCNPPPPLNHPRVG